MQSQDASVRLHLSIDLLRRKEGTRMKPLFSTLRDIPRSTYALFRRRFGVLSLVVGIDVSLALAYLGILILLR